MKQTPIIPPVAVDQLIAELTPERMLRNSNRGSNEIYIVDAHSCPATMREIGRLREDTFRAAGGGTGAELDIDRFDTMENPCKQLIVWDPADKVIIGGYRYILGSDIALDDNGVPEIACAHLFKFSPYFIKHILPSTIELGRSFVRREYQSSRAGAKAIYALDNLWDGLGALTVEHPDMHYLFGKVTMYPSYNRECRDMILYFLNKHFPDTQNLVVPISPLPTTIDIDRMERVFTADNFRDDYRTLNSLIHALGFNIPPLVNAYMSLSPTMRTFGTAINDEFGLVEETGILLKISEISDEKKQRHIRSYHPLRNLFKSRKNKI